MKKLIPVVMITMFILLIVAFISSFFRKQDDSNLFIEGRILSIKTYVKNEVSKEMGYIASLDSEIDSLEISTDEILVTEGVAKEFFEYDKNHKIYFASLQRENLRSPFFKRK